MPQRDNSREKPEICQACYYETTELKPYGAFAMSKFPYTHKWLCDLCATTFSGNALEYPDQYENRHLMFHVCHVGNVLLSEIRKITAGSKESAQREPAQQ
jgi:hypothetical protein